MKPESNIIKNTMPEMIPIIVEITPVVMVANEPRAKVMAPRKRKYNPKASIMDIIKKANEKIRLQISSSIITKSSRLITFFLSLSVK